MNEEEERALAEIAHERGLASKAAEEEAQLAFNQGFGEVRPPELEIRAQPRPAKPSPKREQRDFAQQVNAQAKRGDSGGSGAKMRPAPPSDAEGTYKINKGDTLSAIAKRMGVSVQDLARLNGIENVDRIRAGDTLRLREAPVAEEAMHGDAGPSLLAQKIKAAQARGNPSAMDAVLGININNGYNGGIKQALDTASNYAGAVGAGAAGPVGGLLRSIRKPPMPSPVHELDNNQLNALFRPGSTVRYRR